MIIWHIDSCQELWPIVTGASRFSTRYGCLGRVKKVAGKSHIPSKDLGHLILAGGEGGVLL